MKFLINNKISEVVYPLLIGSLCHLAEGGGKRIYSKDNMKK